MFRLFLALSLGHWRKQVKAVVSVRVALGCFALGAALSGCASAPRKGETALFYSHEIVPGSGGGSQDGRRSGFWARTKPPASSESVFYAVVDGLIVAKYVPRVAPGTALARCIFSPDGTRFAMGVVVMDSDRREADTFLLVDGRESRYENAYVTSGPLFSPDSRRVGYAVSNVATRREYVVIDGRADGEVAVVYPDSLAFGLDSKHYAYMAATQGSPGKARKEGAGGDDGWTLVFDGKQAGQDSGDWIEYGRGLLALGRIVEADNAFRKALALDPACLPAYKLTCLVLERGGRAAEAEEMYKKAIERHAEDSGLWTSYGYCLVALKKDDGALSAFRRSVELNSDTASVVSARLGISGLLKRQGDDEGAAREYEEAAKLDPGIAQALKETSGSGR